MKLGFRGSFRFLEKALQNISGPPNDIDHECGSSRVGDDRQSDLATHRDHQLRTTSEPQLLAELATLAISETKIDRLKILRAPLDREAMIRPHLDGPIRSPARVGDADGGEELAASPA